MTASLLQESPSASLHCVGHSLGAHVCGFLANRLERGGRKTARITGLDPAGIEWTTRRTGIMEVQPMEVLPGTETRLDPGDADLVDVIHTDGNFAGTMVPLGHVDFYVGRTSETLGTSQAGCGCKDNCDHARSFQLYIDSVTANPEVSRVLTCSVTNHTLGNCRKAEGKGSLGYFYHGEGLAGVVGVIMESEGEEMPCSTEEEGEEEAWEEVWEEEEEDWGEDMEGSGEDSSETTLSEKEMKKQISKKTKVFTNQESISKLTTNLPTTPTTRPDKGSHVSLTFQTVVSDSVGRSGWWQLPCNSTCMSVIATSACLSLLCLLAVVYTCARRTYTRMLPRKEDSFLGSITRVYY